jgi:hypothetical protein
MLRYVRCRFQQSEQRDGENCGCGGAGVFSVTGIYHLNISVEPFNVFSIQMMGMKAITHLLPRRYGIKTVRRFFVCSLLPRISASDNTRRI